MDHTITNHRMHVTDEEHHEHDHPHEHTGENVAHMTNADAEQTKLIAGDVTDPIVEPEPIPTTEPIGGSALSTTLTILSLLILLL